MEDRNIQIQLGIAALIASAFLLLVAIPNWVSSPSNVRNIVLSPLFWPNTVAILTALIGAGLVLAGWRSPRSNEPEISDVADRRAAIWRLVAAGLIMVATMYLIPRIGMVWTAMLAFAAFAFLVRTKHPVPALICAVLVPLVLYAFFAHVAGVAIPQGNFVRLP